MNHYRKVILLWIVMVIGLTLSCTRSTSPPNSNLIVYWEKAFGGSDIDYAKSVIETSTGGFLVSGETYSFGGEDADIYLVKTNSNGDSLWTKTLGGAGYDFAQSAIETQDAGFIVVGGSSSFGAQGSDVYLAKIDTDGNILWEKMYGTEFSDYGASVQQTTDGGFIVAGEARSNLYLIKTDQNGDTLWTKKYDVSAAGVGCSALQTSDGGYIVAGYTEICGNIYMIKVDANGDSLWEQVYGTNNDVNYFGSMKKTYDGGYIIAGSTSPFNSLNYDIYLLKTKSNGDAEWTQQYGGEFADYGYGVALLADGGYIIAGRTDALGDGRCDVYLIETDANGNARWKGVHGYENGEGAYSIVVAPDGCYVVAGATTSLGAGSADAYLVKIRSSSWYP